MSKFNQMYKKIITEWTYYRRHHPKMYTIQQIIGATKQMTQDGKGQWLKGQTGKTITNLCYNNEVQGTTTPEQIQYIREFWNKKANRTGNTFDNDIYEAVSHSELNQFEAGKAAYGIFVALNDKYKTDNGLKEPNKGEFVGEVGQKTTLNLQCVKLLYSKDYVGDGWVQVPNGDGFYHWAHPTYTTYIYQLEDEKKNVFICRTSSDKVASLVESLDKFTPIKCTIVGHKVFRDTNQTEIKISAPRTKKIKVVQSDVKPEGNNIPADAEVKTVQEMDDLIQY